METAEQSERGFRLLNLLHHRSESELPPAILIDNFHTYALTFIGAAGFRDLMLRYVFTARGIVLSERSRKDKAKLLIDLSSPVWTVFCGAHWWNLPKVALSVVRDRAELIAKLDAINGPDAEGEAALEAAPS
jgi:hypothetical protein